MVWALLVIHNQFLQGLHSTPESSGNRLQTIPQEARTIQKIRHQKRSNELGTNMPVIGDPLEVPSSAEQPPAPMERTLSDVVHPVQHGVVPGRISLTLGR